jgi:NAD(P)H-dependent FMN reductase
VKVAIVTGSTRPGRVNESVARWVLAVAANRKDADFELLDIADQGLPLLDEPIPPGLGRYTQEHTKRWAARVAPCDAFVFVVPEYNHGIPAALKNAIDFLYAEWNDKSAGFVSYGSTGGVRAVEHLRAVMAELMVADVRGHVSLSLFTDFENYTVFRPQPRHEQEVHAMLDQVITWGGALKTVRDQRRARSAAA